jgi:hypothetical protein
MPTDLDERRAAGAYSLTGDDQRRKRFGWLPWLLLALGVAGLLALLVARNAGDDGDETGVELSDDDAGATSGGTGASETEAGGSGMPNADAAGQLTAGQQALLPLPAGGLAALAGQPAEGRSVTVESVIADEAFWVGSSATDRVLVVLTPEARGTDGESPFQVEAGQLVNLTGTVTALDRDPADFGLDAAEGADQLSTQGAYVLATSVELG